MRKLTLALAAAALLAAAPAASAADYRSRAASSTGRSPNQFSVRRSRRTWLGYVTQHDRRPGRLQRQRRGHGAGDAHRPGGAASTTVDADAARGLDQLYTFSYPVAARAAPTATKASAASS